MNKLILSCLALFSLNIYSQKVIIADTLTKTPIPFATVKYGTINGDYSNEFGKLILPQSLKDSLEISHLGYKTCKIAPTQVKDTIYLTPKATELEKVIVDTKAHEEITFKPLKKAYGWKDCILIPGQELCALMTPKVDYWGFYLDKVHFSFVKINAKKEKSDIYENINAIVRVNIYHVDNGKLGEQIYSSTPIKISSIQKENIEVDISSLMLKASNKSYWFTLEMLGYYGMYGEKLTNEIPYVRPRLTQKENDFCELETYIKFVFNENDNYIKLDDAIRKGGFYKDDDHRDLSIGFTISK